MVPFRRNNESKDRHVHGTSRSREGGGASYKHGRSRGSIMLGSQDQIPESCMLRLVSFAMNYAAGPVFDSRCEPLSIMHSNM